jgi:hypothetical protein
VSQRFADDEITQATTVTSTASSTAAVTATRLQRIEDMVVQLTSQVQSQVGSRDLSQRQDYTPPRTTWNPGPTSQTKPPQTVPPMSTAHSDSPSLLTVEEVVTSTTNLARSARLRVLSHDLHSSLPCPQDIALLRKASERRPVLSLVHITTSYTTLRRDGIQPTQGVLPEPPPVASEPVLMARYMLQIAIFLQDMQATMYPELICLVEPATALIERCATTAINLVTRQDDLHGSIESLEGVILESVYQCNTGHLRLSWMAVQRAMLLAQTMGLHSAGTNSHVQDTRHVLEPSGTRADLAHIWFRIVHYDLQLSRMLGLPPATAGVSRTNNKDQSVMPPYDVAVDTPEGYLERVHLYVSSPPEVITPQALEQKLQRAANSLPSQWWLPPNLAECSHTSSKLFWATRRITTQMLHYDLHTQLNVPIMLARNGSDTQRTELARLACVHSAREVLSRFVLLRDANRTASSCHFTNLLGLMAAITLVLAHLGGGGSRRPQSEDALSSQVDNLLAHQAPSDRTMMQRALETMRSAEEKNEDVLCTKSAHVLQRLLEMEERSTVERSADVSARGQVEPQPGTFTTSSSAPGEGERIFIPYFGAVRIVRPKDQNTACEMAVTTGTGTELGYAQINDAVALYDPLLLDMRDEHWMAQGIDMTFLDAFLEGTM